MDGAALGRAVGAQILIFGAVCAAIGGLVVWVIGWGIPMCWTLAKPLLHELTR